MAIPPVNLNLDPRGYAGPITRDLNLGPSNLTPFLPQILEAIAARRNANAAVGPARQTAMQQEFYQGPQQARRPPPRIMNENLVRSGYATASKGYQPQQFNYGAIADALLSGPRTHRQPGDVEHLAKVLEWLGPEQVAANLRSSGQAFAGGMGTPSFRAQNPLPQPGVGWIPPIPTYEGQGPSRTYGRYPAGTQYGTTPQSGRRRSGFATGGTVPSTGRYKLHEGELVVPARDVTPFLVHHLTRRRLMSDAPFIGSDRTSGKSYARGSVDKELYGRASRGDVQAYRKILTAEGFADEDLKRELSRVQRGARGRMLGLDARSANIRARLEALQAMTGSVPPSLALVPRETFRPPTTDMPFGGPPLGGAPPSGMRGYLGAGGSDEALATLAPRSGYPPGSATPLRPGMMPPRGPVGALPPGGGGMLEAGGAQRLLRAGAEGVSPFAAGAASSVGRAAEEIAPRLSGRAKLLAALGLGVGAASGMIGSGPGLKDDAFYATQVAEGIGPGAPPTPPAPPASQVPEFPMPFPPQPDELARDEAMFARDPSEQSMEDLLGQVRGGNLGTPESPLTIRGELGSREAAHRELAMIPSYQRARDKSESLAGEGERLLDSLKSRRWPDEVRDEIRDRAEDLLGLADRYQKIADRHEKAIDDELEASSGLAAALTKIRERESAIGERQIGAQGGTKMDIEKLRLEGYAVTRSLVGAYRTAREGTGRQREVGKAQIKELLSQLGSLTSDDANDFSEYLANLPPAEAEHWIGKFIERSSGAPLRR